MQNARQKLQQSLAGLLDRLPKRFARKLTAILSDTTNYQTVGLWTSALVAALISVAYAKVFAFTELLIDQMREQFAYAMFIVSPPLFVLAWYLVKRYSPEAAGSGIPQIMAANELDYTGPDKEKVDRLLSLRTAVVKVASSLLCVLGGGAIGREGPTLQICTSIFHFFGLQVRRFTPKTGEQTWVVAGAAAGLASAFNTPLGGIVYAIEELGLVHFHKIRTALLSGVIVSGLVAQWILGSYLYLGFPRLTMVGFSMIPISIFNGAITGICGAAFGRTLHLLMIQRREIIKPSQQVLFTFSCGLVMAGLSFFIPKSSGTGIHVITGILFDNEPSRITLMAARYIGPLVSYVSGAAGGIFSPSLAAGATIGSFLTRFVASDHANLMVMLGMIGFLTGVTRTPFTSFILVLEMTDRHSAIFPMMLAALTANGAARLIDSESFYEHVKYKYLKPTEKTD